MRDRAVLGFLGVLLSLGLLGPALAQAEPDWRSLPYFRHDYGGWMRIWTNENTFEKGARVINFSSAFNPYPGPTVEEQTSEAQVLWGRCNATKQQTFKTSRSVYLPGTPDNLQVSLGAYSRHLYDKPSPIASVELLVNGTPVHKVVATKGNPIPFEPADRAVATITDAPLQYGLNTFTIVGHKKETKKKVGWCSSGDNQFGVLGEVYGEFLADMSVSHQPVQGGTDAVSFKTQLTNQGPSSLIPGSDLGVIVVSGTSEVSGIEVFGVPGCGAAQPYSTSGKSGYRIYCSGFSRLDPGQSIEASVVARWNDAPIGSTSEITLLTTGYGESEAAETANNFETFTVTVVQQ